MIEIVRSNDVVRLSWLLALLKDAGIEAVIFDEHTSIAEGSLLAIPRRLMVETDDAPRARRVLTEAGEGLST
ncbi:MAG: DUF2007 domain-containing protein [Alphaproteobacteria bacterium]|nr:DUF2007 domain-containing protein [Alphaproteobacteria bacterium]